MSHASYNTIRLPAEWEPQDAVLLAWPHVDTDWGPYLVETVEVYKNLIAAITRFESVVVATPDPDTVCTTLDGGAPLERVLIHEVPTQDTWARDFGPMTILNDGSPILLDFQFNGWGNRLPADLDNRITAELHTQGAFGSTRLDCIDLILEGGSIESDGQGTILTTSTCLLNPNRNTGRTKQELEQILREKLGVARFLWLEHGHLLGDDTDAHIDTLVRMAPDDTLLYTRCNDPRDEHYTTLSRMESELRQFLTVKGTPYRLLPLPWPLALYDADDLRLPATYANFLIINGAVLVPTYKVPQDEIALAVVREAFPEREIIGIDCSVLLRQHGSLHCVTMQLPQGVLS